MLKRVMLSMVCFIIVLLITSSNTTLAEDTMLLNAKVTTNSSESYTGFTNTQYTGDNGTRLYILPRSQIVTGVGGALKIFGDNYPFAPAYRDLGVYFHQDQNGDTGTHGTGVFWINAKSEGSPYIGKIPDIGFSFQDGQFVAGRASLISNNPVFVFGQNKASLAQKSSNIRVEMQGDIALRNSNYILWNTADGSRFIGLGADNQDRFKFSSIGGTAFYTNGQLKLETDATKTDVKNALVTSSIKSTAPSETIDATGVNRIKLTSSGTVSNIVGVDGQKITVLFMNDSATIQNGLTIKLQGGQSFTGGTNSTLVLENIEGVWYEISRSVNHS